MEIEEHSMDVDLPDVVAEVRAAFERYEKALVSNDVATLDELFRDDARTDDDLAAIRDDPRFEQALG